MYSRGKRFPFKEDTIRRYVKKESTIFLLGRWSMKKMNKIYELLKDWIILVRLNDDLLLYQKREKDHTRREILLRKYNENTTYQALDTI